MRPIPYHKRADLTKKEIEAISHYKDLVNPQYEWDMKVRKKKGVGIDCQIINGLLRGEYSKLTLSRKDKARFTQSIRHINSAILKSIVNTNLDLFRGLKPFKGLNKFQIGGTVTEQGISSFTSSLRTAKEYSGKNHRGEYIYFHLELKRGSRALYVDSDEKEWILKPMTKFKVRDIERTRLGGRMAIIYHLELTT